MNIKIQSGEASLNALKLLHAARAVGVSKQKIEEMVTLGVLTSSWDRGGNRIIDVAELQRVFGSMEDTRWTG